MAGGLWSRIKTWIANEEILAADLNAEFDNIKTNLSLATLDDISSNVTEMQQTFDPGGVGTENQPTTSGEELKALRSMIKKVTGESVWYVPPGSSLSTLAASIGLTTPDNRLVSGLLDSDNQPMSLQADGSTLDAVVKATLTPLVFSIEGQEYTKSADDTVAVATGPDITNALNQAQFADTVITDDADSKILGEDKPSIIFLDTVGATFAGKKDTLCAFTTTHATDGIEYFIGILRKDSATSEYYLERCRRGFFYNSSQVGQRVRLDESAGQVVAWLQLSYIFIKTDGTLIDTINAPFVATTSPTAIATDDMWFDLTNDKWLRWTGSAWADSTATFLGYTAQKQGACMASRVQHYYKAFDSLCNIGLISQSYESNPTVLQATTVGAEININGTKVNYWADLLEWNAVSDMDTGAIAASTKYYLYLNNEFEPKISLVKPYDRQMDMKGYYHPWKPWRCIGFTYTDSSTYFSTIVGIGGSSHISDGGLNLTKLSSYSNILGGAFSRNIYSYAEVAAVTNTTTSSIKIKTGARPVFYGIIGSTVSGDSVIAVGAGTITMEIRFRNDGDWSGWNVISVASYNLTGTIPCNVSGIFRGVNADAELRATISTNVTVTGRLVACEL